MSFAKMIAASIALLATLCFQADIVAQSSQQAETAVAPLEQQLTAVLNQQAEAWNQGDLEKFMETYWKSDKLTFSGGGKTTRGWQATLDRYRENYAPPKQMGHLTFDHLEVTPIESSAAMLLGQWHLAMKDGEKRDGNFTLVMRKLDGNWKIIHDHSSTLEPGDSKSND